MKIPNPVKIFNKRCAELGEPNKSLFVAKLVKPTFSFDVRTEIIMIKNRFTKNPTIFNINLRLLTI